VQGSGIRFRYQRSRDRCVQSMEVATRQTAKGENQAADAAPDGGF